MTCVPTRSAIRAMKKATGATMRGSIAGIGGIGSRPDRGITIR